MDDNEKPLLQLRAAEIRREGQPKKAPPDIFDGIAAIIGIAAFFIIKIYYFDAIKAWLFGG